MLAEFGIVVSQGIEKLRRRLPDILRDADWLGVVPRQHSSGGKFGLVHITKRGDAYLRHLLIHGAPRSVIASLARRDDAKSRWVKGLRERSGANVSAVALAANTHKLFGHSVSTGVKSVQHRWSEPPEYAEGSYL